MGLFVRQNVSCTFLKELFLPTHLSPSDKSLKVLERLTRMLVQAWFQRTPLRSHYSRYTRMDFFHKKIRSGPTRAMPSIQICILSWTRTWTNINSAFVYPWAAILTAKFWCHGQDFWTVDLMSIFNYLMWSLKYSEDTWPAWSTRYALLPTKGTDVLNLPTSVDKLYHSNIEVALSSRNSTEMVSYW